MARGAIIAGADVIEWFACGVQPIMAGFAGLIGQCMIKVKHVPCGGDVAVLACCIGFDVVGSLARCCLVIVAGKTALKYRRMVNMDLRPENLIVALGAFGVGAGMADGLARGHIAIVAAGATGGHAFKNSASMAGLACHFDMCTMQWEARVTVIEVLIDLGEAISGLCKPRRAAEQKPHRKDGDQHTQPCKTEALQVSTPTNQAGPHQEKTQTLQGVRPANPA